MSDADQGAAAPTRRTRKPSDGKRSVTFVYTSDEGSREAILLKHKTKAFSIKEAWKECVEKHSLTGVTMSGAISGHFDYMANKIRKPTRAELLKIAGLED